MRAGSASSAGRWPPAASADHRERPDRDRGGRLKLSATNLEITMSCWIDADDRGRGRDYGPGAPAGRLRQHAAQRPHLADGGAALAPGAARVRPQRGVRSAAWTPRTSRRRRWCKDGVAVKLDAKGLRQAIAQTVFAAATDDSRPVLTGVDTKFEGSSLTLAASDGFRLSVYKLPAGGAGRRADRDRRAGARRWRS